jgi:hypothetical protein
MTFYNCPGKNYPTRINRSTAIILVAATTCWFFLNSCRSADADIAKVLGPELIGWVTESMTDIMVHDITNPPLAARFYAYASLAGYEVISQNDPSVIGMHGVLNDFPKIIPTGDFPQYHPQISAVIAMIETAATMQPSGVDLLNLKESFLDSCRHWGFSE